MGKINAVKPQGGIIMILRYTCWPEQLNNSSNGNADIEIKPGVFVTWSAYWFLRKLGWEGIFC